MAWAIKVVALCVIIHLIVANNEHKSPLEVFKHPKDITSLFKVGNTYYEAASTVRRGPLEFPRYDSYCGEVRVKTAAPIIIEKRFFYYARGSWHWYRCAVVTLLKEIFNQLKANYSVSIQTDSTGQEARNYAAVTSMHGMKTLVQTLYLLWLEKDTCALLYNNHTGDCESWEFSRHPLNEIGQSDCSKLTVVCRKRSSIRYLEQCYTHYVN